MQESLLKQDEVSLESPFRISINQHVPQATSCFLGLPKPWAMQCVWIVLPHVAQGKVISSWHRCLDADWAYHGGHTLFGTMWNGPHMVSSWDDDFLFGLPMITHISLTLKCGASYFLESCMPHYIITACAGEQDKLSTYKILQQPARRKILNGLDGLRNANEAFYVFDHSFGQNKLWAGWHTLPLEWWMFDSESSVEHVRT